MAEPIIEEPGAAATVEQFQYNSDYPNLPLAQPPAVFPPADPSPCARITTRVYDASKNKVATVQNVLVRTMLPQTSTSHGHSMMSTSSGSSTSDDDELDSDSDEDDRMDEDPATASPSPTTATTERAYWMQRTVREAIYGRVLYAIVLKRAVRTSSSASPAAAAEWQVTDEKCAIKEMSWQHIRKERDRLAEDPIKEVSAMQYLQKWYVQQYRQKQQQQQPSSFTNNNSTNEEDGNFFRPIMETNIMMPLDLLSDDRHLYSIMPYCNGGELFDRLDLNERFSENEARYWMDQVLNGLEHLQRSGICHRDMSLENLLVHENGALIIDMGMCLRIPYASTAQEQQPQMGASAGMLANTFNGMTLERAAVQNNGAPSRATATNDALDAMNPYALNGRVQPRYLISPQGTCGKWIYMSPEIYKSEEPFDGFAVDMWAAGVILFLMLTGFPPWERACGTDDRFKYMTAGYLVQMLTEWNIGLSSDAMDLLQRMLFLDPKDRLSLDQVKAHPWMVNGLRQAPAGPF